MKKVQQLLLFSTLLLTLSACKKDYPPETSNEPVLPPMTHEGLNTFGCYIDGELFVANEGESVWAIPAVSGSFDEETRYLKIQGTRYREDILENQEAGDDVRFRSYILNLEDSYDFNVSEDFTRGYTNTWDSDECDYFYIDYISNLGKLTITYLNEEKNIIAGTFYMTLINPDCEGDTVMNITDGRFDFRY